MKKLIAGAFALALLFSGTVRADGVEWMRDFAKAKEKAAQEGKSLFIDFTGSDWCYWCKKLDGEVLSKEEFAAKAGAKYVFVYLDFPNDPELKAKVVDEELQQKLMEQYGVQGFPSIVLATASGAPYAKTGYQEGGAEAYLKHLTELETKAAPVKALVASKAPTEKELSAGIPVMAELEILGYEGYAPLLEAAKKADPKNEKGLLKHVLAFEESRDLMKLLEGLGPTDQPPWDRIHAHMVKSKYLSGPMFVNLGFGCAKEYLIKEGKHAEAVALFERIAADPVLKDEEQAQTMIKKEIEDCRAEMKKAEDAQKTEDGKEG